MDFTVFAKEHGFSSYEEMMQSTTTVIYDEFINWNATITNDGWIAWVDDPLGLIGMYETYDQLLKSVNDIFEVTGREVDEILAQEEREKQKQQSMIPIQ